MALETTLRLPSSVTSRSAERVPKIKPKERPFSYLEIAPLELKEIERRISSGRSAFDSRQMLQREANFEKSKRRLSERGKEICSAQYRALKYLYVDGDVEVPADRNPLTDILALIAPNLRDINLDPDDPIVYQLCHPGLPRQKDLLASLSNRLREDQFVVKTSSTGEKKKYRSLAQFGSWQTTVIRSLHLMSYVAHEEPEVLREALTDYVARFTESQGTSHAVALGVLELLNNTHLLTDEKFENFAYELRDIVLEGVGDYATLSRDWHYSVVDNSFFWLKGKVQTLPSQKADQENTEHAERSKYNFPKTSSWRHLVTRRGSILRQIGEATDRSAVISAAPASEEELLDAVVDVRNRIKPMLSEKRGIVEKDLRSFIATDLEPIIRSIAGETSLDIGDFKYLERAMHIVFEHFESDPLVSRKLRSNIHRSTDYHLRAEAYSHISLVRWLVLFRKDPKAVEIFKAWAREQPNSLYLTFKATLAKAAKHSFASSEKEFLFDKDYETKATPKSLLALIDKLTNFARNEKFDIQTVLNQARQVMPEATKPYLQSEVLKRRRAELARMLNRIHWRRWGMIQQYTTITRKDVAQLVGYPMLLGGVIAGTLVGVAEMQNASPSEFDRKVFPHPSEFRGDTDKRLPDALTPEAVKAIKPKPYFDVLHSPKELAKKGGGYVGFFPTNLEDTFGAFQPFGNVDIKDWVWRPDTSKASDASLIYRVDYPGEVVYQPDDWHLTQITQEKGSKPYQSQDFGYVRYGQGESETPFYSVLWTEPGNPLRIDNRVELIRDSSSSSYNPHLNVEKREKAWKLNEQLSGDPDLQKLHADFLRDMEEWDDKYYSSGDNFDEAVAQSTAIINKYISKYQEYTDAKRYYALNFQISPEEKDDEFGALKAIAQKSGEGYFCDVASHAFKEFFQSVGVEATREVGMDLYLKYDNLWGRLSHAKNIVRLPNGQILRVDMTPNVTERTPQEDIDALNGTDSTENAIQNNKSPWDQFIDNIKAQFDVKHEMKEGSDKKGDNFSALIESPFERHDLGGFEDLFKTVTQVGIPIGGAAMLYLSGRCMRKDLTLRLLNGRVTESLKQMGNLSPVEQRLWIATAYKFARLPFDDHFMTKANYLFELLGEFEPNHQGRLMNWLLDNPEGKDAFRLKDAKQAFLKLQSIYANNIGKFQEALPGKVQKVFAMLAKEASPHNQVYLENDDVPFDFTIAYELGRMVFEEERRFVATKGIYQLGQGDKQFGETKFFGDVATIDRKANELKALIQLRYARGEVNRAHRPLYNMLLTLLAEPTLLDISRTEHNLPTREKEKGKSGSGGDPEKSARIQRAFKQGNFQSSYRFPTRVKSTA